MKFGILFLNLEISATKLEKKKDKSNKAANIKFYAFFFVPCFVYGADEKSNSIFSFQMLQEAAMLILVFRH